MKYWKTQRYASLWGVNTIRIASLVRYISALKHRDKVKFGMYTPLRLHQMGKKEKFYKTKKTCYFHHSMKILSKNHHKLGCEQNTVKCIYSILNVSLSTWIFYGFQPQPRQMKMSHCSVMLFHSWYLIPSS